MWSKNNSHSEDGGGLELFRYFFVALITYWLINFVFTTNTLSPLHQDDYAVLGAGLENFRWSVERPVSTNLAYFMGQMGPWFSFALLNFLTAALPAMVLYFLSSLLQVRLGWFLVAAFSVMTFGHLAAFEHGKYLGLITNLTSHFFGCLALIALMRVLRKPSLPTSAIAVVAYGLSVFAKEDFLLPPLLLLVYFGVELYYPRTGIAAEAIDRLAHKKQWWLKMNLWFVALAAASVLFSVLMRNPFLAGAVGHVGSSAHYAVSFDPSVLLAAFLKLTIEYSPWHTIAGVVTVIALTVAWKERRRELVLLTAIVFCLILPYALISNRILPYRVFAWLPWLSAPVVIASALLWRGEVAIVSGGKTAKVFAVALFLVPLLIGYLDRIPRLMVAGWYASAQQSNRLMIDSIVANKALLDKEDVVGVIGVEGLSPWSNNDGAYMQKKLGFSNRWVVFVDKSTMFFTIREQVPSSTYVSVAPFQRLCVNPALLVMKFDSFGAGAPLRAATLCTPSEVKK